MLALIPLGPYCASTIHQGLLSLVTSSCQW